MTWQSRSVPLKFQLSDLNLFRVTLRVKTRTVKLIEDLPPVRSPEPPDNIPLEDADGFLIRGLPIDGPLRRITRRGPYLCYAPLQYRHCYIDLQQSFDRYQNKFSSKTRSTIKRKMRKFAEHCGGALVWKSYRTPAQFAEFFQLARSISMLTYQERLLDAGLPVSPSFIRQAEALAAEQRMRAYLLFHGDKPVSYLYCPVQDDVVTYAYLGYDPGYLSFSVGTILQWLALDDLYKEHRYRFFDFTEGQSAHKQLFATHQRECANVFLLRGTVRNTVLIYSHAFTDFLSARLGDLLDRFGLKARVRRLMRFASLRKTQWKAP